MAEADLGRRTRVSPTATYEAVVRWLGERAFGEQGLMLNRSLFEDMVDAHFTSGRLLTTDEERALAQRIELCDEAARRALVEGTCAWLYLWPDGCTAPAAGCR